jgi:CheY-like chemotaxis protein
MLRRRLRVLERERALADCATNAIRDPRTGAPIPIIAISAQAIPGERERCLAAGMAGYIVMPIDADELFAAIESAVSHAQAANH